MKLYRTASGLVVEHNSHYYSSTNVALDGLITRDDLEQHLTRIIPHWTAVDEGALTNCARPLAARKSGEPGVTYYRSRTARMAESPEGGSFYDRVYDAERPEIFFKATLAPRGWPQSERSRSAATRNGQFPSLNWHC